MKNRILPSVSFGTTSTITLYNKAPAINASSEKCSFVDIVKNEAIRTPSNVEEDRRSLSDNFSVTCACRFESET